MKALLLILVCALILSASAITIIDKFKAKPPEPQSASRMQAAAGKTDPALLDRMDRIEKLLADVTEMLQIPPIDPATASRPTEPGEDPRPLPVGLGQRLQYVESALVDLQRQSNLDIMQLYSKLNKHLNEFEVELAAVTSRPSKHAPSTDDLKKLGVNYNAAEKRIDIEAMFTQPTRTLEFFGVASGGNAYESMLVLNVTPSALKRAIASMEVKEADDPDPRSQLPPRGDGVYVYVTWEGRAKPCRIEDLVIGASGGGKLPHTKFVFTASREFVDRVTWEDHFAADVYKNVVALAWRYASDCVLACPLMEAQYEDRWVPDMAAVPAAETHATLIILREPRSDWDT